ncbi:MAG: FAD-dependent monooxygenase [Desulfobacterales bacterium]|jgi:2-polyprenyl-6-methoxyphenol hydroxylase-like FAD-dependent oxidoreductase
MHNLHEKINWQPAAGSISDRLWDVIIIGAGPAGGIAAGHLAERHHRVLMLDRQKFPREKVCGDGLLPDALRCLDTIGIGILSADRVRKRSTDLKIKFKMFIDTLPLARELMQQSDRTTALHGRFAV